MSLTTRTTLPWPNNKSVTLPKVRGVDWLFLISTNSITLSGVSVEVHLEHNCRLLRYSENHSFQNAWWHWWRSFHHETKRLEVSKKFGSGTHKSGWPVRKWPRVTLSKTPGSKDNSVNGLEFNTDSIRQTTVLSSSYVRVWTPIMRTNKLFVDLTTASHRPPK